MSESTPGPPEWLSLEADEQVWIQASPSANLVLASLAVGFGLLLGMSVLVGFFTDVATGRVVSFVVLLLILTLLAAAYFVMNRREYVLTSKRVYAGIGLSSKRVSSANLADVSDVTVEQSGWQQLLNMGTLRFVTDGERESIEFALVENPAYVYQRVLQFVDVSGAKAEPSAGDTGGRNSA